MVFKDVCDVLSHVLDMLPDEVQEAFKLSKPSFAYISTAYDAEKHLQRVQEFKNLCLVEYLTCQHRHFCFDCLIVSLQR